MVSEIDPGTGRLLDSSLLVSIGIPTYNRSASLGRAISSALAQDYPNIELVISNNGSTDDTEAICKEYCAKDSRVRYLRQPINRGPTANFQEVLHKSRGDLFMWLSDDDWLDPSYVSTCVKFLASHHDYVLAAGNAKYYRDGQCVGEGEPSDLMSDCPSRRFLDFYWSVVCGHVFYGVMNREMLSGIRNVNALAYDWFMLGAIAFLGKVKTLPSVCIHRSLGGASSSIANIVASQGLPSYQQRLPYLSICGNTIRYTVVQSPTFKSIGIIRRVLLAGRAASIIYRRYCLWPWWRKQARAWQARLGRSGGTGL